jgi:hypothetical protein
MRCLLFWRNATKHYFLIAKLAMPMSPLLNGLMSGMSPQGDNVAEWKDISPIPPVMPPMMIIGKNFLVKSQL